MDATKKLLNEVKAPTLIVHSTEDDMASLENAHFTEANISSKIIEKFYIDDTYHVLTLDRRKEDIAKRTAQFCKDQVARMMALETVVT
jgi:carboxylesterase